MEPDASVPEEAKCCSQPEKQPLMGQGQRKNTSQSQSANVGLLLISNVISRIYYLLGLTRKAGQFTHKPQPDVNSKDLCCMF